MAEFNALSNELNKHFKDMDDSVQDFDDDDGSSSTQSGDGA